MAFASLDIPNFRALRNLKVEDLRRVNILVGRNNSGKTSLLEAVELLCALPDIQHFFHELTHQRKSNLGDVRPVGMLFPDGEGLGEVTLSCTREVYSTNNSIDLASMSIQFLLTSQGHDYFPGVPEIQPVNYKIPNQEYTEYWKYEGLLKLNGEEADSWWIYEYGPLQQQADIFQTRVYSTWEGGHSEHLTTMDSVYCLFIYVNQYFEQYNKHLEKAFKAKKRKIVRDIISQIDSRILDIELMPSGLLYFDIGKSSLLPLNAAGEGTHRVVRLLTSLLSLPPGGVCLIDEIDTGLHYTALPVMWKAVLQAAESNDVQVFATTHSDECVEALVEVLKEKSEQEGKPLEDADCALYRLEQAEDGTKAHRYDMDMLRYSLKMDWGFR